MRTGRSLTVCCSLLRGGGVCLVRGVSAPGGVSAPRGWGVVGCLLLGGLLRGGIPACTETDTPPPCGQTHACENITSLRPLKMGFSCLPLLLPGNLIYAGDNCGVTIWYASIFQYTKGVYTKGKYPFLYAPDLPVHYLAGSIQEWENYLHLHMT